MADPQKQSSRAPTPGEPAPVSDTTEPTGASAAARAAASGRFPAWRGYGRFIAATLSLGVTLAVATRLTIRDTLPGFDIVFYATPLVLVTVAALAAAILWFVNGHRRTSVLFAAVAVVCGAWFHATTYEHHHAAAITGPATVRVLVWNIAHRAASETGVIERLRRYDADVMILAESDRRDDPPDFWQGHFPDYACAGEAYGLTVLARGDAEAVGASQLTVNAKYRHTRVDVGGVTFDVIQPDIKAHPWRSRRPGFAALWRMIEPLCDRPLMVAGDFNTPPDSACFDRWRSRLANAFETAGAGYHMTWPVPLPVLALDQAWVSDGLVVRRADLDSSWLSDHRVLLLDVEPRQRP